MKNTIRVHRNGGKKSRPSQVQSRRAQAGADNVRIIIHEPGGGLFADFEIPQSYYDAMRRDAEAKGIGLDQWIERAVRERVENAPAQTNNVSLQFFSENRGSSLAHVDLTPEQFATLQCKATARGYSLEQFLNRGILQILALAEYSTLELESAQYQSNALLELLVLALTSESNPDWTGTLGAGLTNLATSTQARLASAFDKTHAVISLKSQEVAS